MLSLVWPAARVQVVKALLLDLDGTLLGMDWETFMQRYFQLLTAEFSDVMPADQLYRKVWRATEAMMANEDPRMTNRDVFLKDFFSDAPLTAEELLPRFDYFYRHRFPELGKYTERVPGAQTVVRTARSLGLAVVIATNPVFPRLAIEERMRWAGLAGFDFDLVTTYENMHACKPHPRYYEEIAEKLGVAPSDCLMAGNDVEEDMSAGLVGMKTFLVDRWLISRGGMEWEPDGRGSLADLTCYLHQLVAASGRAVAADS